MKKLPLFLLLVALAGCATMSSTSKVTYAPDIPKQSAANLPLFQNLLTAMGGVGSADRSAFPNPKERTLTHIDVVLRYDNRRTGVERWTIRHGPNDVVVYQVMLIPDGEGNTDFYVRKE